MNFDNLKIILLCTSPIFVGGFVLAKKRHKYELQKIKEKHWELYGKEKEIYDKNLKIIKKNIDEGTLSSWEIENAAYKISNSPFFDDKYLYAYLNVIKFKNDNSNIVNKKDLHGPHSWFVPNPYKFCFSNKYCTKQELFEELYDKASRCD